MTGTPLKAAIIPVTPLQQNCCLIWCTKTMRGAFTDPGGDLPKLREAVSQSGVTIEKIRHVRRRAWRANRGPACG